MALQQTQELERILQMAAERRNALNVYLIPDEPVCFRDDHGHIERAEGEVLTAEEVHAIAAAAIGGDRLAQIGMEVGEIITACGLAGVIDGRMCVTRAKGRLSISIHTAFTPILDAAAVGLPQAMIDAALSRFGLVLFSGPPASGKTTTMLAAVEEINRRRACCICTVEDPPLCVTILPKKAIVQQREIGIDVPDFVSGVRAALRQGCDVLVVGEMRAPDQVAACVSMAAMGCLVVAQLNQATPQQAIKAVWQLLDAPAREEFASVLGGVCAQRLVARADGKGRVAAYGVLIPDQEMRAAIGEGRDPLVRKSPLPPGCQTMAEHVRKLEQDGVITQEAAEEALAAIG